MEGGKKVLAVVVLLVVIVGAVGLILKNTKDRNAPPTPIMKQPIELIDAETGELMTRSLQEWKDGGMQENRYKNPNTGKYTMAEPIKCYSCSEVIPMPLLPNVDPNTTPPEDMPRLSDERTAKKNAARCPKCGGPVFRSLGP